ncbi:MAG TPA: DUF4920 domain-containing protein [Ignavibacteria bacterium]|nr:DUF4920 domain-containing protein [Ignavibacteria bacterium]
MKNLQKRISLLVITIILISTSAFAQNHEKSASTEPVGTATADGMLYGKDFDPGMTAMDYGDLLKSADENNERVILVKGTVAEVCQGMGCWMVMTDGSKSVRATTSHEFFLPKDIAGREAVIYGKFKITEISEDDARHYNEESKNPVSNESIVGPQKVMEIDAIGIKILNTSSDKN